jgi:hypothetical protein
MQQPGRNFCVCLRRLSVRGVGERGGDLRAGGPKPRFQSVEQNLPSTNLLRCWPAEQPNAKARVPEANSAYTSACGLGPLPAR